MSDSNLLKVCQLNLFGDIMQTLIVPRVLYKSKEGLLFFFLKRCHSSSSKDQRKCSYMFVLHTNGKSHV